MVSEQFMLAGHEALTWVTSWNPYMAFREVKGMRGQKLQGCLALGAVMTLT